MSATGDPELPAEEFQQVPAGNPNDGGATKRGWRGREGPGGSAPSSVLRRRPSPSDEPAAVPAEARARVHRGDRVGSASLHPPGLPYLREGVRLHSPDG